LIEEALESGEDAATSYLDRLAATCAPDGLDVDVGTRPAQPTTSSSKPRSV
jgi:hypothetical protein